MCTGVAACLVAATLAGCASRAMNREFARLETAVRDRTGYNLEWIPVTAEQEAVASHVASLLEDELTADEAVQVALLNNRELQAMYARMGIQVGQYVEAGLLPNPVLDAEIRLRNGERIIEGTLVEDVLEILLIPLRRRLEGAELTAVQNRVAAAVIDIAAETRIAFWDYVAARQHLALAEDMLFTNLARFRMATQLREAGNVPLLLFYMEREAFEHAKLDVAEAQMEMLDSREQLNALMGLWGEGTLWETPARLPSVPPQEIELTNIEGRAIDASLDLGIRLYELVAQAQELGIGRVTAVIPELKAGMALEREPTEKRKIVKREYANGDTEYKLKTKEGPDAWWDGPTFSVEIPIFDQNQGRRAAARMAVRQRWEEISDLAIDIRAAARLAAYRLEYTRKRAEFYNEVLVPVRHQVVLQSHLRYNAMSQGIFDLLIDKEHELRTSRDYIESLRHYWVARTQTEQLLMGRLYDTEVHSTGHSRELRRSTGIEGPEKEGRNRNGH